MKLLLVLTCLMAVCFAATNAASVDTRALRNLLLKVLNKRQTEMPCNPACEGNAVCDDGFCIVKCTSDSDCASFEACVMDVGICGGRKCDPTATPDPCPSGSVCVGGYPGDAANEGECCAGGKKRSLMIDDLKKLVKKWEKK